MAQSDNTTNPMEISAVSNTSNLDELPSRRVATAATTTTASSSMVLTVHPLVIMNISEHWTRIRAQNNGIAIKVFGALLGKQSGRCIELMNSFEVRWDARENSDEHVVIDAAFFAIREGQYKEVFAELDFLGWYTTGSDAPSSVDIDVYRQMSQINECPIMLKLDPASARSSDKLPLDIYESVIDVVRGETHMQLVPVAWSLATEEAERIGVDHVARITVAHTGSQSAATKQLLANHGAVKMLHERLQLIVEYLKSVESGQLPRNEVICRQIATLCHRLPVMDSDRFQRELHNQCSDIKLTAYLGALTKICGSVNQLVGKLNVLSERQGTGGMRRVRGGMLL